MDAGDNTKRRVNDLAERYAGSLNRSSGENDMRKDLREKIEELGYSAKAFQPAVSIAKSMTRSEADHYLTSMQFFVEALLGRQGELFPAAAAKIEKRLAKAAEKPRTQAELDEHTDTSPKSDPDAGGAKPQVDNAAEQAEGEAALAAGLKGTAKASQSAKAAAKRSAAGLN
jgi:hypothetical protein